MFSLPVHGRYKNLQSNNYSNKRALRSRSLRDGSLSYKGRFATFVRSCSALRASRRPLKISYLKSACLITPFGLWNQVNPTIFEICLLNVNNNNKYPYEKFLNAKFESAHLFTYNYFWVLVSISIISAVFIPPSL